jgi:hypothetical protein
VIGVALFEAAVDVRDLVLEVVDQLDRGADVRAPGLGHLEPLQEPSAFGPEEIGDRASAAEVDQGRVDAALECRLVLHQVEAKAGELALLSDPGVGEPDRRHQVAVREHRQDLRVDLVGLAGQRRQALDLLGVGDLDLPAFLFERVVDEPRARHRLDHRVDGLAVDLGDSSGEGPQRVDVGWDGELVEMLSPLGEQADVELLSTQV